MKVVITDTFTKSLIRIIKRERFYWKAWDFFRYDIPRFCRNVWRFRKELWTSYPWDSVYTLMMLKRNLELTADYLEKHGIEVEISRQKKIKAIRRAIEILDHQINDSFVELAEKRLGHEFKVGNLIFDEANADEEGNAPIKFQDFGEEVESMNRQILDLSYQIEENEWKELFRILQGQDINEYKNTKAELTNDPEADWSKWENWFDGTGLKGWWD